MTPKQNTKTAAPREDANPVEAPAGPALPKGVKVYPIVKYGDPILERQSKPVMTFDADLQQLCADMFISMYAAQGVGLAAPQIGVDLRLSVIDTSVGKNPEAKIVIANPEIIHAEGEQREDEGCLSLPGFRGNVLRPLFVTVRAQDAFGETFEMRGENLLARAFCHEIDHLNGILFIQHLSLLKRDMIRRRIKKLRKAGEW
ncbi:MAG TPA: peptide deformylase [Candidatus Acidoferrales bacterium]|nr:peptide deformylase [Candidatus Acidoferrales bacterium]